MRVLSPEDGHASVIMDGRPRRLAFKRSSQMPTVSSSAAMTTTFSDRVSDRE
jgi:hypothetical protein